MTGKLAILGVYPPPYGGVATHVERLSALLDERGVAHTIYNAVSMSTDGRHVVPVADHRRSWMLRYVMTAPERVIYICSARLEVWLLTPLLVARGKRVIIWLRNVALPNYLASKRTRALASWALRQATYVVGVSEELADAARAAGVADERVIHLPGFLPPPSPPPGEDGLTSSQRQFVATHQPLIAANGKVEWYEGTDLYGLDHLVELVGRLKPSYPSIGLVVGFWGHNPEDEARLEDLRKRARELGVEDNILWHLEPWPFVPVLGRADVFVRPTCTDGDAVSVRESLYLGVPTFASDIVKRPDGTMLVRTRDLEDLVAKVGNTLATRPPRAPRHDVVDLAKVGEYLDLLTRLAA